MISKDLVAASSTPLVLSILSIGESYGYAIIKAVKELSSDELEWTDGMLYPVLHKLESQGLIASSWRTGENRRRRKYYGITTSGRQELESLRSQWASVHSALTRVWEELEDQDD